MRARSRSPFIGWPFRTLILVSWMGVAASVPAAAHLPVAEQVPAEIARLTAECQDGKFASCLELARRYQAGEGVAKDEARAVAFDRKACDGGDATGCFDLAYAYDEGAGVAKDKARAAALYKQSCDADFAKACHNLAVMYASGSGVIKDEAAVTIRTAICGIVDRVDVEDKDGTT